MKIGITGGGGVIGKILKKKLKKSNFKIINFNYDIRNSVQINKWVKKNNFDTIFHLAALVSVKECEKEPLKACQINIGGTIKILDAIANQKKKPYFFFTSTSHVYKVKNKALLETDSIAPRSFYGYTKWLCEKIIESYSVKHNISYCCARIFSFYHNSQSKDFLYPSIKTKIKSAKQEKIYIDNSNNIIEIKNKETLAKIIFKIFKKKTTGIINVGSGKGVSIKKFAMNLTKKKLHIFTNTKKITKVIANVKKLHSIIRR